MKLLLNYATPTFRSSQRLNTRSGLQYGAFDQVLSFGPKDLDRDFVRRHRAVFRIRKGAGLWLWKPYVVERGLRFLADGDFLFYCDAGARFIGSVDRLIAAATEQGRNIMAFELTLPESDWTKRDAFVRMGCDTPYFVESKQRLASFFLLRKSREAETFVAEYLRHACDALLIGDDTNALGQPNYPGFVAHRNDQSIFSLLSKRYGLPAYRDPSQWGNGLEAAYPNSPYPQLIEHTRKRTHSLLGRLWYRFDRPQGLRASRQLGDPRLRH